MLSEVDALSPVLWVFRISGSWSLEVFREVAM